jgi:hypothetical protein
VPLPALPPAVVPLPALAPAPAVPVPPLAVMAPPLATLPPELVPAVLVVPAPSPGVPESELVDPQPGRTLPSAAPVATTSSERTVELRNERFLCASMAVNLFDGCTEVHASDFAQASPATFVSAWNFSLPRPTQNSAAIFAGRSQNEKSVCVF